MQPEYIRKDAEAKLETHKRFVTLKQQQIEQPAQLSQAWFAKRRSITELMGLTGSKLSGLLFISTKDELDCYREEIWGKLFGHPRKKIWSPESKLWINWGSTYEPVATLSFLDACPHMYILEAPLMQSNCHNWAASSPDGFYVDTSCVDTEGKPEMGVVEIKCPGKSKKANTKPTYYYIAQVRRLHSLLHYTYFE
jgi:hypothetical protein